MQTLGLGGMRMTFEWRPGKRNLTRPEHDALRRVVTAHRSGVRIVLGVYGRAADAPREPEAREDYCRFVRNVVRPLRRDPGRGDLERGELGHVLAAPGGRARRLRGVARALLGRAARLRPGRERPDDDGFEPRSSRIHPRDRRRLPRERPRAAALRRRRPQPVPALSRRVSDRPARRLHRPGGLRPARGGPRRVLRRHGTTGRRRSGTSRTASRRPSRTGAARTTRVRRTSRARSRRPSRRRSSRPRSGSRAASRA